MIGACDRPLAVAAAILVLLVPGCGKSPAPVAEVHLRAFDSADPMLKTNFVRALDLMRSKDYVGARFILVTLQGQPNLSEAQAQALEQAQAALADQLYDAARRRDPAAIKAVEQFRQAPRR
jgi:hypothetical protein